MNQPRERDQFGQWATNEFYELYQVDPFTALRTAHERSEILSADDRRVLAVAFSSVAAGAGEKAALLGGGKLPVWLVMGAVSVTMAQFGLGPWSVIPVGLACVLALYDRKACLGRVEAYYAVAELLKETLKSQPPRPGTGTATE
ncbi:hypothetical protein APB26_32840 [Pseudomonas aeruginosa]|uniref:hypothetical protein n=1 Tax=Pseudomonas aeruginosa TaxID=287 RepID=UPI00071B773E|nr:hypothetical protein [Pseudomonas aeruginosa]KSQ21768.1 hypothetical protein APB26_32840 [Pseudomonas aeruginosa]RPV61442.1 hypothetical protein IPC838_19185 [Pseudomonas aeruginosa]